MKRRPAGRLISPNKLPKRELLRRLKKAAPEGQVNVNQCRSCKAVIYWQVTKAGKYAPYDVIDGQRSDVPHFSTCPQAKEWRKPPKEKSA